MQSSNRLVKQRKQVEEAFYFMLRYNGIQTPVKVYGGFFSDRMRIKHPARRSSFAYTHTGVDEALHSFIHELAFAIQTSKSPSPISYYQVKVYGKS